MSSEPSPQPVRNIPARRTPAGQGPPLQGLAGLLSRAFQLKRAMPRQNRNQLVYVFSDDQVLGEAELLDESELGARLKCADPRVLEEARYLLHPGRGAAATLQMAWRRGEEAGFAYSDVQLLRGYLAAPHLDHVRRFWSTSAHGTGMIAPAGAFLRRA